MHLVGIVHEVLQFFKAIGTVVYLNVRQAQLIESCTVPEGFKDVDELVCYLDAIKAKRLQVRGGFKELNKH